MDFRGTKVFDYVSATKNLTENEKKYKAKTLKWLHDYMWLCDQYRFLEKKLDELCHEKQTRESAKEIDDKRTCLPFPKTSNDSYGWLAKKPEFELKTYGSFIVKYPDPMDEVILLGGNMPTLAGGKGFF